MATKTEMANMALSHLGIGIEIANLDTDASADAQTMRRYFDVAFNTFQRDFPTALETKQATLGLVTEDPNDVWGYEYTYPADCQFAGEIVSNMGRDREDGKIPYRITRGTSSRVIWTNCKDAVLEYQIVETDTGRVISDMELAFTYLLAYLAAPRTTGGDPFKLKAENQADYELAKTEYQANSLNEQQELPEPISEFIAVRDGDIFITTKSDNTIHPDNTDIF